MKRRHRRRHRELEPEEVEEYKLEIIPRKMWDAAEPRAPLKEFEKLPDLVRVVTTGTPTCSDYAECAAMTLDIQDRDMEDDLLDIQYNFLISPGGLVFEGRSWKHMPYVDGQRHKSRCLILAIIGEYMNIIPPIEALRAVGDLLNMALEKKHIDRYFRILPFHSYPRPKEETKPKPSPFLQFEDMVPVTKLSYLFD